MHPTKIALQPARYRGRNGRCAVIFVTDGTNGPLSDRPSATDWI